MEITPERTDSQLRGAQAPSRLILPVMFAAQLLFDLLEVVTPIAVIGVGVALNGWAIKRRRQRRANSGIADG